MFRKVFQQDHPGTTRNLPKMSSNFVLQVHDRGGHIMTGKLIKLVKVRKEKNESLISITAAMDIMNEPQDVAIIEKDGYLIIKPLN